MISLKQSMRLHVVWDEGFVRVWKFVKILLQTDVDFKAVLYLKTSYFFSYLLS